MYTKDHEKDPKNMASGRMCRSSKRAGDTTHSIEDGGAALVCLRLLMRNLLGSQSCAIL